MDMNNTPEPRMPLVENLEFLDLMGVISSPCTMGCARTLHSTRIRRSIDRRRLSGVSHQSLGSAVSIGTTFGWHNRKAQVEPFLKTDRLSDTERAMLMGGATAKAYGWSPKKA